MNKKINIKSIVIVFFAMIIGIYLIFFQNQIITGLFIIAGGISLNFLEVAEWMNDLISFFKSFNKDDDEPESEKKHLKKNPANNNDFIIECFRKIFWEYDRYPEGHRLKQLQKLLEEEIDKRRRI